MGRCLAVLLLMIFTAPALAQSGAVGTGEDGCYFGRCEGDRTDNRRTDDTFDRERPPVNPPGPLM